MGKLGFYTSGVSAEVGSKEKVSGNKDLRQYCAMSSIAGSISSNQLGIIRELTCKKSEHKKTGQEDKERLLTFAKATGRPGMNENWLLGFLTK